MSLPDARTLAEQIVDDLGDQMSEAYAALPDLISERCDTWWGMEPDSRRALVQAVAEHIGGPGYEWRGDL